MVSEASNQHSELRESLAVAIEDVLLMDSPEGDSPRNIAANLREILRGLDSLEQQLETAWLIAKQRTAERDEELGRANAAVAKLLALEERCDEMGNQLAQERSKPGGSFDQAAEVQRLEEQLETVVQERNDLIGRNQFLSTEQVRADVLQEQYEDAIEELAARDQEVATLTGAYHMLEEQLETLREAGKGCYEMLTFVAYWEPSQNAKIQRARAAWEDVYGKSAASSPAKSPKEE